MFSQLLHESRDWFDDQCQINEQLHEMTAQAQSLARQAHQVESIPQFVAGGETVQMGSSSQGWYSDERCTNDGERHADADEYYEETVDNSEEVTL